MIALILKLLAISFAFHFYKNRYPNEFKAFSKQIFDYIENNERLKPIMPYLVKVGYAVIYAYSFCQIALNKVIQITTPYVKMLRDKIMPCKMCTNSSLTSSTKKTVVSFYNNGSLIKQDELAELSTLLISNIQDCQPPKVLNLVTITVSDSVSNILTFIPKECKYDLLELRFIALYLKQDDKTHIIELCQNNYNYYIVGNSINSSFLKYYLKNVLNVEIDNSKPFMYTLELMDHNVQMIYLDQSQAIVFQKDGYSIEEVINPELSEFKSETKESEEKSESKDVINIVEEAISETINEVVDEVISKAVKSEEKEEDYDHLPELIEENVKEN